MIFNCGSSVSHNSIQLLCQYYLHVVYQEIRSIASNNSQLLTETQGEILPKSIDKFLATISLSEEDVFIDFGSGNGKIVAQVFLSTVVKEAIGIEISSELHQHAISAATRIQQDLPDLFIKGRKLSFLQGDFLNTLVSPTIALINATCFNQTILQELGQIINQTSSIHTVASLRPIATLNRLKFKRTMRLECSWDTSLCYVYSK